MNIQNLKDFLESKYCKSFNSIEVIQDGWDNCVYKLNTNQGSFSARVSKRDKNTSEIEFELRLCNFLEKEGFPVPSVQITDSGEYYSLFDNNPIVLQRWVDSDSIQIGKGIKPKLDVCFNAGVKLAELHNITSTYSPENMPNRKIEGELLRILEIQSNFLKFYDGAIFFMDDVKSVLSRYQGYKENLDNKKQIIHNDYRAQNILVSGDNVVAVLDFDWSCEGYAIKDLAHALVEWSLPDGADQHWDDVWHNFLDGYKSVHSIDENDIKAWVLFSTLADSSTYFMDKLESEYSPDISGVKMRSYMYKKFKYFKEIL